MSENQEVIVYSFGFTVDNIIFCWKHKNLYRMAYIKKQRSYSKRKLKQQKVGNSLGYWICGTFKSMKTLKQITQKIRYEEVIFYQDNSPF